jgi:NAD(P)-dependent dehydrogenase (short-subunit alcohol dehydrogenase family)
MEIEVESMNFKGKSVFISGGSRGLGFLLSQTFINEGANIAICGRSQPELFRAIQMLKERSEAFQSVRGFVVDVSDRVQVEQMAAQVLQEIGPIDALICNAGVLGPMGSFLENDLDEWIHALNVNLVGTLYLVYSFLPQMVERGAGKVIQLSGGGASNPLPGLTSYAASKAAVIRFIETLAKEYTRFGIDINGVAPGMLKTRLLDEMLDAGPERVGSELFQKSVRKSSEAFDSSVQACELIKFLASEESNGISGRLISAEWDNWREWPNHLERLQNSDLYTLRRIVGRDRDQKWGDL